MSVQEAMRSSIAVQQGKVRQVGQQCLSLSSCVYMLADPHEKRRSSSVSTASSLLPAVPASCLPARLPACLPQLLRLPAGLPQLLLPAQLLTFDHFVFSPFEKHALAGADVTQLLDSPVAGVRLF
jgi:hypothetical protein